MQDLKKIFIKKKILIYGLGISGISSLNFLKKENYVKAYDDKLKQNHLKNLNKYLIKKKNILKTNFDHIIISPGINFKKCGLKKILTKNKNKICTDLDIFYTNYSKNFTIAITGTNGKSTTVKLITKILKNSGRDARCVGNIGKSILSEKKIKKNTIFVIEASSYQIEYSNFFKSKYSIFLNISPDHLERHGNMRNYLDAKLKLFNKKSKNDVAFINQKNSFLNNAIKKKYLKCKIYKVKENINQKYNNFIKNKYFIHKNNQENLSFVFAICEKLKIKKKLIIKTINKFKGLKYRQQIIYNSKKLCIINDSKSTSFASSANLLNSYDNIFWILGGLPKLNDKLIFKKKKNMNIQAYIFGKNKKQFIANLKKKIIFQTFSSIKNALKKVLIDIQNTENKSKNTILFSPASASFDKFKNFEERGEYFNSLIKTLKINK